MEFALRLDAREYEVRLVGARGGLTLAEALGRHTRPGDGFVVDGRFVDPDRPVATTIHPGSVVEVVVPGLDAQGPAPFDDGDGRGGRRSFNRPPRSEYRVALPPIHAPSSREVPRSRFRFGWAALVVPVVLGIVLAVVIHPRMALFAVFAPAMALANWIEERRRARQGVRRNSEELRDELSAFHATLVATVAAEQRLRTRAHPGLDELIGWVERSDSRLWERRRHHDDALKLALGTACVAWSPDLVSGYGGPAREVSALIDELGLLHDVPVEVRLQPGDIVGVAGGAMQRRSIARSLLIQVAALHGPSDVRLTIVTDHAPSWDWAKWLPHVVLDPQTGRRHVAGSPEDAATVLSSYGAHGRESGPVTAGDTAPCELLVVDVADIAHPAHGPIRTAIERAAVGAGAVLVLAANVSALSSRCRAVVEVEERGDAVMRIADQGVRIADISPWTLPTPRCRAVARRLAGVQDPDVRHATADIPEQVRLVDLLGMPAPSADAVAACWAANADRDPAVPVGFGADGPFAVSLVTDGPHALLAGTTGSGKSEFLRSLVASMAASSSPEELTFVLVDYKGGSAFDVCAQLPHTVGLVTDLDGHLAQRALTCLEAELRYREEEFRVVGASDLAAYRTSGAERPLPRLFVVVDEFAALAKELPEFMSSLIDIAQRGRSLGVHLLLATQRPQGVINDQIRANTNLRIALRVQDAADSADVIGTRSAAEIGRSQPGRGYVRLGAGEVQMFQAALVTGPATGPPDPELHPLVFAPEQPEPPRAPASPDAPTDLHVLVGAIASATEQLGIASPRRPWPEPLSDDLIVGQIGGEPQPHRAIVGLADEPGRQRQRPVTWTPADGNLLLYGVAGSGTTTTLATLAVGLAGSSRPDDVHLYVLDFDDQLLAPLSGLAHVGGVVGASDRERQVRLIRMLQREIDDRRHAVAADPTALADMATTVLLIDNYAGFAAAFDEPTDLAVKGALTRVVADGPGVGVVSVVTAKQPVDVPAQVSSLIPAKLLFRLSDRYEYAGLGVSGVEPPTTPGRCYESWTGREVQIARAHAAGPAAAVAMVESPIALDRPPAVVGVLPPEVKVSEVLGAATVYDLEWTLPLGIGDAELAPVGFRLGEGDHVVISGPARSGKSTALATLARVAKTARPDLHVVAVSPRRSPLRECPEVDTLAETTEVLGEILDEHHAVLVLVDDATMVDDSEGLLAGLADRPRPGVHVVAAAPADVLRSAYGHWTAGMRRSRIGLALKPNVAADGDLWQTNLPRRGPVRFAVGRGYLVSEGQCELIQVASA